MKQGNSPGWVGVTLGVSILCYLALFWLVDIKKKNKYFDFIKFAATATLTCYLLPYLYGSLMNILHIGKLPEWATVGAVGLIKCALFSWVIIRLTGLLGKMNMGLKL